MLRENTFLGGDMEDEGWEDALPMVTAAKSSKRVMEETGSENAGRASGTNSEPKLPR